MTYQTIAAHLIKMTEFTRKSLQTGAITLAQRSGDGKNFLKIKRLKYTL
jgi:hypothetical protein